MAAPLRVEISSLLESYNRTRSVWKTAKELGITGQSVWERLRSTGVTLQHPEWTDEELAELKALAGHESIGEIARRLGRTYAAVASKLSRGGIPSQRPRTKKPPRAAVYDEVMVTNLMADAEAFDGPITRFCRSRGLSVELFVRSVQRFLPLRWAAYARGRYPVEEKTCAYCSGRFIPTSGKQRTCSRKCQAARRVDESYFGGKRRTTVGLAEGVCQLCRKPVARLASHHVLGKENDPDNEQLVALCNGCHHIVSILSGRKFIEDPQTWEDLISLCMARRLADKGEGAVGVYVCVETEWLSPEKAEEWREYEEAASGHVAAQVPADELPLLARL